MERATQLGGHFAEAFANWALLLAKQQDWPAAEALCRRAVECGGPAGHKALAECSAIKGSLCLQKRRLAKQSGSRQWMRRCGTTVACLWLLGKNQDAAGACERSLSLRPTAEAYNTLGTIRLFERQSEAARSCFEAALRLNPRFCEAQVNLGNLLALEGRDEEARECFFDADHFAAKPVLRLKAGLVQPVIVRWRTNGLPAENAWKRLFPSWRILPCRWQIRCKRLA